jgi:hypothetical protein
MQLEEHCKQADAERKQRMDLKFAKYIPAAYWKFCSFSRQSFLEFLNEHVIERQCGQVLNKYNCRCKATIHAYLVQEKIHGRFTGYYLQVKCTDGHVYRYSIESAM